MTSATFNYFPRDIPPNIITLGIRASTYELWVEGEVLPWWLVIKNPPTSAGDAGSVPGQGKIPHA